MMVMVMVVMVMVVMVVMVMMSFLFVCVENIHSQNHHYFWILFCIILLRSP